MALAAFCCNRSMIIGLSVTLIFFLMQAAAHAAHPTVASAPLAACAKERHVTPVAVSDGSASSAFSVHVMEPV